MVQHAMQPGIMRPIFNAGLIASLLLFIQPLALADDIIDAQLVNKKGGLFESMDPEVNVSGNIVVGVMVREAYQALRNNHLGIAPTYRQGEQSLCLKISSRDGAYTSENVYQFTADDKDKLVSLSYDTGMQKIVKEYTAVPGAIAIAVMPGNCNATAETKYLLPTILHRESKSLDKGKLVLYINSIGATDVSYRVASPGNKEFSDCSYINEGKHTAYDFSCEIDLAGPIPVDKLKVEIKREIFGREIKPGLTLELMRPGKALAGNSQ